MKGHFGRLVLYAFGLLLGFPLLATLTSTSAAGGGPAAAYGFNEGSGSIVADASGNNLTGAVSGATWTASGRYGTALAFDPASSYVDLGRPALLTTTASMTWEAWIFATGTPADDGQIVALSDGVAGWELKTTPDAGPRNFGMLVSGPGNTWAQRTSSATVALNTWTHVAAVYNALSQTLDVYVNGVLDDGLLIGTVPTSQALPAGVNVNIGRRTGGQGYHFIGRIDEVRIYNRTLSKTEIQADMVSPIGGTIATATPTATNTPTPTAGQTSTPTPTSTSTSTPTASATPSPTATQTPLATSTPSPVATSTPSPVATATPSPTALALQAAYGLDEGTGTTTADVSGNGITGTVNGAAWTTSGKYGNALSFNAASSYVDLGRPAALLTTASMTWEAWVYATGTPADDGQIIALSDGNTGWELKTTPDAGPRTFGILVSGPGGTWGERASSTSVSLNTWYHVAGVYTAATRSLDIYVNGVLNDGVLLGGVPSSQVLPLGLNVNIGRRSGGTGFHFIGTIDEVRVYSRALSPAEIQKDMNAAVPGASDTQPPTAPGTFIATPDSGAQVNLSWTASTDNGTLAGYLLERCQGLGCTAFTQIASPTGTSFTDRCLPVNTSFTYRVRAIDTAGNIGPYAAASTAATAASPSPTAPGSLTATATSANQINLSWIASTGNLGVAQYSVERCQGSGCASFASLGTSPGTTYSDQGLTSAMSYSYRVQAIDVASNGSPCTVASAVTLSLTYPLRVGASGRYLVDQSNQPVFWSGDAAWSLIVQGTSADMDTYLSNRQAKGVNVVLVNLIDHMFGTNAPRNINGDAPFTGKPFVTPNEAYFAHADYAVAGAAQRGMAILLDPLYLGSQCGSEGWCAEVQAASIADLQSWGTYVGTRYKGYDNIVWVIGGDADPTATLGVSSRVGAFATALNQADGRHLMTAHNAIGEMAITPWPGATWLAVNATYSRFGSDTYQLGQTAYARSPTRPYFQIEGYYENEHAMTTQQLRTQAYWTVLSGGMGYIFGNCPVWGMGSPASSFCPSINPDWHLQLDTPGATGMQHVMEFFRPRAWQNLVPDSGHTTLTAGYGTFGGTDYATAARAPDGSLVVAYLPTTRTVSVDMTQLRGSASARWYDPTSGTYATIAGSPFVNSGTAQFTPLAPNADGDSDWVLVLQAPP